MTRRIPWVEELTEDHGLAGELAFHSQSQEVLKVIRSGELGRGVYGRAQLCCWYSPMAGAWRQNPSHREAAKESRCSAAYDRRFSESTTSALIERRHRRFIRSFHSFKVEVALQWIGIQSFVYRIIFGISLDLGESGE
jgi:hypothetical protein